MILGFVLGVAFSFVFFRLLIKAVKNAAREGAEEALEKDESDDWWKNSGEDDD